MDRNQPIDTDIIIDEADPPPQMIRTSVNGSILTPAEELLANQAERVRQWSDDNDLTSTRTHDYPPRIEFDFTPRKTEHLNGATVEAKGASLTAEDFDRALRAKLERKCDELGIPPWLRPQGIPYERGNDLDDHLAKEREGE